MISTSGHEVTKIQGGAGLQWYITFVTLVNIQLVILIVGNRKKLAFTLSLRVFSSFFIKVGREVKNERKKKQGKVS